LDFKQTQKVSAVVLFAAIGLPSCFSDNPHATHGKHKASGKSANIELANVADEAQSREHKPATPFNPEYSLINQNGEPVTNSSYPGKYQFIFFGFTNCPDVCPTGLSLFTNAMQEIDKQTVAKITPIFISVDPERDTPEQLKKYIANFSPELLGLTAEDPKVIRRITNGFRAFAMKDVSGHEGHYNMSHTSLFYVIGPDGNALGTFNSTISKVEMASKIRGFIKDPD